MTDTMPRTGGQFSGPVYGADETPTNDLELVTKAYVDSVSGGGTPAAFVDRETPSGSVDGSNATFTLAGTPVAGSEHVYLNGVLQDSGDDYTISTATITFATAPASGGKVRVSYRTSNGSSSFSDRETPSGSVDGSNTSFTLAHTPTSGAEHVYLNGSLMDSGDDYTISGGTITFSAAPASGSKIRVSYRY